MRSNPIVQSDLVKDWANHVDMRDKESKQPGYGLVDKVLAVPGDVMNWAALRLGSSFGPDQGRAYQGEFLQPDSTVQQLYKEYSANPNDEHLKREWHDALNYGRVNLLRGR